MNYSLLDFMMLIGSLGLFLFGMKTMSEGLQKAAGNKLRSVLTAMTKNRFAGVLAGLIITAIIQSSSATTVMLVSFVNAGLISLVQSISVIMGANIGSTLTAWIIAVFGFSINISTFAIPLLAIAIPLIFSSKGKHKSYGEFIVGFSLLFLGLQFMKSSMPDIQNNPEMLEFLKRFTQSGFLSVLFFFVVGAILTVIVQSSSATMTITLIMVTQGWISYELAVGMCLGENLGTTITANIAAIPVNVSAKRAALAHTVFNIFGVTWVLILFYPMLGLVGNFSELIGIGNPNLFTQEIISNPNAAHILSADVSLLSAEDVAYREVLMKYRTSTAYGLALFHTVFNVTNTLIMVWFTKPIAKLVSFVLKSKTTDDSEFQLRYISMGLLSTSELSLVQAWNEIKSYSLRAQRMFEIVRKFYSEQDENEAVKLFTRIQKYEGISDRMEVEIASYLTRVSDGRLSPESKYQVQKMLRVVSEIESICDGCYNIGRTIVRRNENKVVYTEEMHNNIQLMMNLVDKAIQQMIDALENDDVSYEEFIRSENTENEINNFRDRLKTQNILDVNSKKYKYQISVTYMDIITECEKMGDYIINVLEALHQASVLRA